jgi:acetyl-CoA acetyltransferase
MSQNAETSPPTPLARRAFILGGAVMPFIGKHNPDFIWKGHPDFGTRENPTIEQQITAAVRAALDATGVDAAQVDKAWIGNFVGELFNNQGHLGAAVVGADHGLRNKPVMRVEGGAEVQTTASARQGGDYLARAAHYARQRGIDDFTFPALFARRAKAANAAYGLSEADLAHVAVKAYDNANKNPRAHMRAFKMDFDTAASEGPRNPKFLANEDLRDFLKVSDCSQVSDGAAALILVSERGLERLGRSLSDTCEVVGFAVATGDLYEDGDPLRLDTTAAAAARAYAQAGVGPADIEIAEVHDCFTITELLMMEALGFCAQGQAAAQVAAGRTAIDGALPINTGGGLVGYGHPVGATGVKQLLEIHSQMKGTCGDYQVARSLGLGLCANMGGDDKTAVVTILANR